MTMTTIPVAPISAAVAAAATTVAPKVCYPTDTRGQYPTRHQKNGHWVVPDPIPVTYPEKNGYYLIQYLSFLETLWVLPKVGR